MRKTLQVDPKVKILIDEMQHLYGLRSVGETVAFIVIYHYEKIKDSMTAVDFIEYQKLARDVSFPLSPFKQGTSNVE